MLTLLFVEIYYLHFIPYFYFSLQTNHPKDKTNTGVLILMVSNYWNVEQRC